MQSNRQQSLAMNDQIHILASPQKTKIHYNIMTRFIIMVAVALILVLVEITLKGTGKVLAYVTGFTWAHRKYKTAILEGGLQK